MGHFDHEAELEAALREAGAEPIAATMRLLDDIRLELVQPVPTTVADSHLAAMRTIASQRPAVDDELPSKCTAVSRNRLRGRHWSRRVGVFCACLGATFAYGGLATAGALPGVHAVAAHVGSWLGVGVSSSPRRPTTPNFVPGHAVTGPPLLVPIAPNSRAPMPGSAVEPRYGGRTDSPGSAPSDAATPRGTARGVTKTPNAQTPTTGTTTPADKTTNNNSTTHGNSSNAPGQSTRGESNNAPGHTTSTGQTTHGPSDNGSAHTSTTSHTAPGNAADHAKNSNGANNAG